MCRMQTRNSSSLSRNLSLAVCLLSLVTACGQSGRWDDVPVTMTAQARNTTAAPSSKMNAPSAAATAAATPTIGAALRLPTPDPNKYPTDKAGHVLGGNVPIINYAPSLVTGKPCPRVKKWKALPLTTSTGEVANDNKLFVASDPCVVQNAIDDFVEIALAIPTFNDREKMLEIGKLYETDPVLIKGIEPGFVKQSLAQKKYYASFPGYRVCDPVTFNLIDPRPNAKMDRTGKVLEIGLIDVLSGMKPTSCKSFRFDTGIQIWAGKLDPKNYMREGFHIFTYWMFWSDKEQRWQFRGLASPYNRLKFDVVQQIYKAAPYKP